jgi:serine protease Do
MELKTMNFTKNRTTRTAMLAGAAVALVLGGAVFGGSLEITRSAPAYADAVQVQSVAPPSFADTIDQVRPAVVSVRVQATAADTSSQDNNFFDLPPGSPLDRFFRQFQQNNPQAAPSPRQAPQGQPETALGSGFFISDDGYVVTNNHVVANETSVTVIMDDGKEYPAKVVGTDDKTDLALLKVDVPNVKFTYVKFSEAQPRVGDWVVAVGNPFGLGGTVTAGIISAEGRDIGDGPYDNFLQIDAAVNRGNSGGPAFNYKGEVVGINTAIFSPSGGSVGIAFAIPASTAEGVIAQLKDHGSITRGWLGVSIQPITQDIADSLQLKDTNGALVADMTSGSPAAKAGIAVGDAILAVDGQAVKDSRDLSLKISNTPPGKSVNVTYWRNGMSHDVQVTLGTLPSDQQLASASPPPTTRNGGNTNQATTLSDFGVTLGRSPDNSGVAITNIDPNGQAAARGLQTGDVIVAVGDTMVTNPRDVQQKIADAKAAGMKAVLLRVKSGDRTEFVALSFSAP